MTDQRHDNGRTPEADDESTDQQTARGGRPRRAGGGGRQGYGYAAAGANSSGLVEVLKKYDLPPDVERFLEPELNRDHILGNLDDDEIRYRRFSLWNNQEMIIASFPPQESFWQGERRKDAEALGDGRTALTQEQMHGIRDAFDAAFARVSRSRGGWQQEKLADQSTERREVIEDDTGEEGGFLSRLLG